MDRRLAELREDWAQKKKRYEDLLFTWFPPVEPGQPPPPLRPVPPEVMAQLEAMEKEVENARLVYVSALLYGGRG